MTCKNFGCMSIIALFIANTAAWGCANIYIPCLPAVAADFGITDTMAKLTILLGTIGAIFTRIIVGPMSDFLGRKNLTVLFLLLSIIGLLGCYFSTDIYWFLFFRLFQGIGSGAVFVQVMSILSDTQTGSKRATLLGIVELSWPIGWGISPLLGAFISAHYHWRLNFIILIAVLSIVAIYIVIFMPETLDRTYVTQKQFSLKRILKGYITLTKHKLFLSYAVIPGLVLGGYMIFAINGPFIYKNSFNYSAQKFALLQSFPLVAYFISVLLYGFITSKFGFTNAYKTGFLLYVIYSILTLVFLLTIIPYTPIAIICVICTQCLANAFLIPSNSARALQYTPNSLGTASSYISLVRNIIVSCAMMISGFVEITIFNTFALIFFLNILVFYLTSKRNRMLKHIKSITEFRTQGQITNIDHKPGTIDDDQDYRSA